MSNVELYWRETLAAAPFRFSHPRILAADFAATPAGAAVATASRVVRAVAEDLGVDRNRR